MTNIFWFRRDLRLADNPALNAALQGEGTTYLVATADQLGSPFAELSTIRQNSLRSSWSHLNDSLNSCLCVVQSPAELVRLAALLEVSAVYASTAYDTNSVLELNAVSRDLGGLGIEFVLGPGNYAVAPGTVRKEDGSAYRVYTPFYRSWLNHISSTPVPKTSISSIAAVPKALTSFDPELALGKGTIAGETQAIATLKRFIANRLSRYHELRDRPDIGGTSHLSHALSHGEIHPRTILSLLPDTPGTEVFVKELAWREFYADVLHQNPHSLTEYLDVKFKKMRYNDPGKALEAWKQGNTGYPMVDAGLRQLRQTGWMHNRVRMIVASFLIKDLHIEWQHGADWFERNLTDFDPASNSHGWQWTAGCGTDAAPYFRIFNPVTQGLKFDPDGEYVRKYVPELRHLPGASAHEPWNNPHGYSLGYSKRIVDHAIERDESLARLAEIKST